MPVNALGIINGRDKPLIFASTVPQAGPSMRAWFQKLALVLVRKQIVDFEEKEVREPFTTNGVIQPLSTRELEMKPEGQRAWEWQMLHCENGLTLIPDEIVEYHGTKYRVMGQKSYSAYGYLYYELVNDYGRRLA